jgi:hypothetical protein
MQYRNTDRQKPESKFDINKIILKSITKIPKQITANIIAVSTYNDAKIMKKIFWHRIRVGNKIESERCSNLAQKQQNSDCFRSIRDSQR